MTRFRALVAGACLLATAAFVLALGGGPRALAKGKKEDHLRFQLSYAAAVQEAKARNAVIFATFHKDN